MKKFWSGKGDSNSRPQPWQGYALPTELFPRSLSNFLNKKPNEKILSGKGDSNSRPQPWQGYALPTELFPHAVYNTSTDNRVKIFLLRRMLIA